MAIFKNDNQISRKVAIPDWPATIWWPSLTPAIISAQNADARGLGYVTRAIPEGKLRLYWWILTTFSLRNKNNANNDGFDARVKEIPASNQRNDVSMILLDDCFSFIIGVAPLS